MKIKKILSHLFFPSLVTLFALTNVVYADIENKLGCGDTIRECIMYAIGQLQFIVVGVTVVVIIVAGIIYLFAGGNEQTATRAKMTLYGAVLGFAIVIGASILINEVGRALGWKGVEDQEGEGAHGIIARTITFLFGLLGAISIGGILVGAGMYIMSAGDEERANKGKKIIIYSIVGTVIALSATLIVRQVERIMLQ
jgi:hypothetical protein